MNDKVLIFSDPHIGEHGTFYKHGENLRLYDIQKSLNFILQYVIDNKIRYIIIGGDVFKTRHPNSYELSIFNKFINSAKENNTEIHLVLGNHDYIRENLNIATPLLKLNLDNVFVYETIEDIKIPGHKILAIPYNINDVNRVKKISKDYELIVGHKGLNCIRGFEGDGSYEDYFSDKNKQLILLGHYHGFTKIKDNCYFIGDVIQLTFAEAGQKKYFCVFNSYKKYEFIEIPTRKLIDIKIDNIRALQKLDIPKRSIVRFFIEDKIERDVLVDYCIKKYIYMQSILYNNEKDSGGEIKQGKDIKTKGQKSLLKDYLKTVGKEKLLNVCENLIDKR